MFDVFGKKLEIKHEEMKKGDIKDSVADVCLAEKELCFKPSRSLKEELVKL